MKHWQTSTLGVMAILSAIFGAVTALIDGNPNTNPDWATIVTGISAGIGLLRAPDATKVDALAASLQSNKTP